MGGPAYFNVTVYPSGKSKANQLLATPIGVQTLRSFTGIGFARLVGSRSFSIPASARRPSSHARFFTPDFSVTAIA
jgi:hypothetical protein